MALAAAVLLAGCTWVPMKKEAAGVQVLRLGQDASACQRLGEIAVSVKSGIGSLQRNPIEVRDELETLARNEALTLHADSVQPLAEPAGGRQRWLAFRCAGAQSQSSPLVSPVTPQAQAPQSKLGPTLTGRVGDPEPFVAFVSKVEPNYPKVEECEGITGKVLVQVVVGRDGQPADVKIERSSRNRHLDDSVVEAAKKWKFESPLQNGEAAQVIVRVPIEFGPEAPCSTRNELDLIGPTGQH